MTPSQVCSEINSMVSRYGSDTKVSADTLLTGPSSPLDSLTLIQLCAWLEAQAFDAGGVFKWSTEDLMSNNSFFRTCESIAAEYNAQNK